MVRAFVGDSTTTSRFIREIDNSEDSEDSSAASPRHTRAGKARSCGRKCTERATLVSSVCRLYRMRCRKRLLRPFPNPIYLSRSAMTTRYSLVAVCALAICMGSTAIAQERQVVDVSPVVVDRPADRGDDTVTLRHFDPDGAAAVIVSAEGFVFGTNEYGDLGKSVAFELPTGFATADVLQINAWAFTSGSAVLTSYDAVVWAGTEDTGPTDEIGRQEFSIDLVAGQGGADPAVGVTEHVFDSPITVDGPFHVGFQWGASHAPQDFGMVSSTVLASPSPYEWEQWDDEGWRNVASAWSSNGWNVWIEVVLRDPAVSTDDGAQAREIVLSSVYPNPVASTSHIELEVATTQHVKAEVFNMLGQRVATVFEGTAPVGRSVLPVNGANLVPGIYLVRVVGDDFSTARRFVVAH